MEGNGMEGNKKANSQELIESHSLSFYNFLVKPFKKNNVHNIKYRKIYRFQ